MLKRRCSEAPLQSQSGGAGGSACRRGHYAIAWVAENVETCLVKYSLEICLLTTGVYASASHWFVCSGIQMLSSISPAPSCSAMPTAALLLLHALQSA